MLADILDLSVIAGCWAMVILVIASGSAVVQLLSLVAVSGVIALIMLTWSETP